MIPCIILLMSQPSCQSERWIFLVPESYIFAETKRLFYINVRACHEVGAVRSASLGSVWADIFHSTCPTSISLSRDLQCVCVCRGCQWREFVFFGLDHLKIPSTFPFPPSHYNHSEIFFMLPPLNKKKERKKKIEVIVCSLPNEQIRANRIKFPLSSSQRKPHELFGPQKPLMTMHLSNVQVGRTGPWTRSISQPSFENINDLFMKRRPTILHKRNTDRHSRLPKSAAEEM